MFKFLKDKLKQAVGKFSKSVDEETEEIDEVIEKQAEEKLEEKSEAVVEEKSEAVVEEKSEEQSEAVVEEKPEAVVEEKSEAVVEEKSEAVVEPEAKKVKEPEAESEPEKEEKVPEEVKKDIVPEIEEDVKEEVKEKESSEPEATEEVKEEEPASEPEPEKEEKSEEVQEEPEPELEVEQKEEIKEEVEEIPPEPDPEVLSESIVEQKEEVKEEVIKKELPEIESTKQELEPSFEPEVAEEKPKKGFFSKLFGKKVKVKEPEAVEKVISESKSEPAFEPIVEKPVEQVVTSPAPETVKLKVIEQSKDKAEVVQKVEDTASELELVQEPKDKTEVVQEPQEAAPGLPLATEPAKKGLFGRLKDKVTKKSLSEDKFEELFWDLEVVLLENNVAMEVIDKIKDDLKEKLVDEKVLRGKIAEIISDTLTTSLRDLFIEPELSILDAVKTKKPYVILFLGVNGSGKTTNLAKLANYFKENGLSVVMAACDTFRAAAIQQLEEHSVNLDIKMIKQEYGSDAAAVAFDAIKHAESKDRDIVLIDTAGRSHSNVNLMDELKKVVRISNPDLKIFVGDSLTGNDTVEQAKSFDKAVGIDGVILSKMDVDEKGGAAVSISYITRKPILFIGTGQTYADIKPFNKDELLANLGF